MIKELLAINVGHTYYPYGPLGFTIYDIQVSITEDRWVVGTALLIDGTDLLGIIITDYPKVLLYEDATQRDSKYYLSSVDLKLQRQLAENNLMQVRLDEYDGDCLP